MVGIIEHQQGLAHSSVLEKVQQVKQDNLNVYQQYTAAEIQHKNTQKQREINESKKPDDLCVSVKKKKEQRQKKKNSKNEHTREDNETEQNKSIHFVDIIV